ncbi:hypothetical protein Kim5_PC00135 (plasmid) [Rhizobium sp. Kim5]|nr:hypothetical protein Kim5_PC00135 [Rhizobium sp. Kim5]
MITDVLQFRLHPYATIIMNSVRLNGRFLAPKALTTDIRALSRSHLEAFAVSKTAVVKVRRRFAAT